MSTFPRYFAASRLTFDKPMPCSGAGPPGTSGAFVETGRFVLLSNTTSPSKEFFTDMRKNLFFLLPEREIYLSPRRHPPTGFQRILQQVVYNDRNVIRIGEVEQFYDGIRRMKHEMKNHLTNIKGLAGSGSYEEMEQYIARMDESMDAFEMSVRTGNAVTDVIVNDKQKAAERMGIRFRSDFVYPASDRYYPFPYGRKLLLFHEILLFLLLQPYHLLP
jgi:hypothetical protein